MENIATKSIITLRLICCAVFLYNTVYISLASVISFFVLLGSIFLLHLHPKTIKVKVKDDPNINPLKGKPRLLQDDLSPDIHNKVANIVSEFVTYDGAEADSLHSFDVIKQNSNCIFAKKAKLWGSLGYDDSVSLEINIDKSLPTFLKFCSLCQHLGLDGFVFEFPSYIGHNIEIFGERVSHILAYISKQDPSGYDCFNSTNVGKNGWVFEFNKVTYFITTFAPCYMENHPRYSFNSDHCFILFQPEISFAQHNLPPDTIDTSWINPKTVRDQIRIEFKNSGREYHIRNKLSFPMIYDIVRPTDKYQNNFVWWKKT